MSEERLPPSVPETHRREPGAVRPFRRPAARRPGGSTAVPASPRYDATLDRVFADVAHREEALTRERSQAPALLAELERLPDGRRKLLIRNSRRFQSWALCQLLVEASHHQGLNDPAKSLELAELATEVAERLDGDCYSHGLVHDLRAAAWAQLGNALRINSDLRRADEAFSIAGELLERGSGDPLERARVLDLEASLRSAQRRFDDSLRLLDFAIASYEEVGDHHRAGRALIKQGTVYNLTGDSDLAIERLQAGLARIDVEAEPRLMLYAQHNLTLFLTEGGRVLEAQALLAETRRLHQRFGNDHLRLRLRWLEGKIAVRLGHAEEAEEALLEVEKGFLDRGIGYTAAIVCLELAALYARQRRHGEIKRLAAAMLPIFRAQDVHREAMAALLLFHQAVEGERITLALIDEIRTYLDQAQENPRLRFTPSVRSAR